MSKQHGPQPLHDNASMTWTPSHDIVSAAAIRQCAEDWIHGAVQAIDVEIRHHKGSVPRNAGTHMLVSTNAVVGTIGGGHLEFKAIAIAREHLQRADLRSPQEITFALGPSLGQCCGGSVLIRMQQLTKQALSAWPQPPERFFLQLYGAGHVGRAIVRLLSNLPCKVQWIDERDNELPPPRWPHIERICVDTVEAEVTHAPPGAHYLVLTHSHEVDLRVIEAILRRNDFASCGLIGSATKRARFIQRLRQRGIGEKAMADLSCPIGVEGIEGKEPEVLAIAIVAELLRRTS